MLKVKLSILALALFAVALSHSYFAGFNAGLSDSDSQAFNAYVAFAKPFHTQQATPIKHTAKSSTEAHTVWAVLQEGK